MRVIPPITIDDNVLLSSTVAEPTVGVDPGEWLAGATYTVGTRVMVSAVHKIYECTTGVTGGDSPNVSVTRAVPKWIEIGSTNKWAMFDLYRSTPTESTTEEMTVILGTETTIRPDSLALLNLGNVASVQILATSTDDDTLRYDQTYSLTNRNTLTWYSYFYGSYNLQTDLVLFDIPTQYGELRIEIIFTGSPGMTIGSCVIGNSTILGNIQRGNTLDSMNFSSIERDEFGNAYMVQRRSISKTTQRIFIDKSKLNTLLALRKELTAVPAVWIGTEDINDPYFTAQLIVGFYTDLSFQIDNPIGPLITLELEEI